MSRFVDRTGITYGRLTVIEQAANGNPVKGFPRGVLRWLCQCECGTRTIVAGNALATGGTRSCGCLQRDTVSAQCQSRRKHKNRNLYLIYHFYGLTEEEYLQLLEDQNGGCAICGKLPTEERRLCVDHDHTCCPGKRSCGKCVRGLLCDGCNLGIGYLNEDPDRMIAAAAYTIKSKAEVSVSC